MMRQRRVVDNREEIPDMYDVQERMLYMGNQSYQNTYPVETQWETIVKRVQKDVAIKLLLQEK